MKKHNFKLPYIFVVGNEKGGVGKTTCCMHLISYLLSQNLKVASIDADHRQGSLSTYVKNRETHNLTNSDSKMLESTHFVTKESFLQNTKEKEEEEKKFFEETILAAKSVAEVIVIDTPGSNTYISRLAHSYADTIITPINDSFVDMDVLAKVDPITLKVISPSIYSEMIWKQKMERAARDGFSIEWIVVRNRLNNVDAQNKKNVFTVLSELSKRVSFKIAPGFTERVIFKELFLHGITLLDVGKTNYAKAFTPSNVAARQELRDFMSYIDVEQIINLKKELNNQ